MKTKFTYLWMVVMTMVLALGFTACSDDDEPAGASASILGEWEQINDAGTVIVINFQSGKRGGRGFGDKKGRLPCFAVGDGLQII